MRLWENKLEYYCFTDHLNHLPLWPIQKWNAMITWPVFCKLLFEHHFLKYEVVTFLGKFTKNKIYTYFILRLNPSCSINSDQVSFIFILQILPISKLQDLFRIRMNGQMKNPGPAPSMKCIIWSKRTSMLAPQSMDLNLKEYLKNKVKMSCYIQPDQSSGLILIMKNIFAMTHELGDVNARRRLFVSHSHDIVLLFACLRIGVSWHNFNVTTAKRMLIGVSMGVSKSHKISKKGYLWNLSI